MEYNAKKDPTRRSTTEREFRQMLEGRGAMAPSPFEDHNHHQPKETPVMND
jgi:hypothetical protein